RAGGKRIGEVRAGGHVGGSNTRGEGRAAHGGSGAVAVDACAALDDLLEMVPDHVPQVGNAGVHAEVPDADPGEVVGPHPVVLDVQGGRIVVVALAIAVAAGVPEREPRNLADRVPLASEALGQD